MYVQPNYKTKKALKDALAAGRTITVFQPNQLIPGEPNGTVYLEGPHYPEPHRWYATGTVDASGRLLRVK